MAAQPISTIEAKRRCAAVEACLREGFSPLGQSGGKGSAVQEAARRLGIASGTLNHSIREQHIKPDWTVFATPTAPNAVPRIDIPKQADPAALDRVLASLRKKPMHLNAIAEAAGVTRGQAMDAIEALHSTGVNVVLRNDTYVIDRDMAPAFIGETTHEYTSRKDNTFVFGATSDNHLGSRYERLDVLNDLYDRFAKRGVDRVFNAGNWIDGEARFNKFDIHTHGMDAQMRYLAKNYPQRKGITTYAVAGDDHEGWYGAREGVDVGRIAERAMRDVGRTDWINLGYMEAHIKLVNANTGKSVSLACVHPGGGSAYALSYSIQKIIESLDGGEKPAVGLYGHYHKLWAGNIRNVWCLQTGCFTGNTNIELDGSIKKIRDIEVGDQVMTHQGRYRRVTRLFTRLHKNSMISLNYGRLGRFDQTLTATPEHPVLTERNGARVWIKICDLLPGETVFVKSKRCPITNERMPFWLNMSKNANPMDRASARDKLSAAKGGSKRTRGGSDGAIHIAEDVLPFCEEMRAQGWRMIPVGAGVIPDAIGVKDGKIVAFEIEKATGRALEFKKAKYEGAPIMRCVDAVEWVHLTKRVIQPRSWYEDDPETGFCKVLVLSVKATVPKRAIRVYNFEVEEDNSYVAGRVVVHNCTEDQTPFMRKKKLEAHVGGAVVELEQDPESGAIIGFTPKMIRYFNRGYYNNRWSYSDAVTPAERVISP